MAVNWNKVRERVLARIEERYGETSTTVLARVARAAHISYTTLARFLHLHSGASRPTSRLQAGSLDRLAEALEIHSTWLQEGQGSEQRAFWPHLVETDEELIGLDPIAELQAALALPLGLPKSTVLQMCRSAVAAMLDAGAASGHLLPLVFYRLQMKLDASQQLVQNRTSGGPHGRNYA